MDQSLEELLHGRTLRVPDYQRGYAWGDQQLEEFWEDLRVLRPGQNHYTGTVVLLPHDAEEKIQDDRGTVYEPADIVDGQQRLTTFTMLFAELERRFRSSGLEPEADGIRDTYISYMKDGGREPITNLGRDINRFWKKSILELEGPAPIALQPNLHSERLLLAAKRFFADKLEDLSESQPDFVTQIRDLRDKVANRLRFTLYEVQEDAQVGVIFETLNDRGKPLTELEKVKNYLMFLASGLGPGQSQTLIDRINDAWSRIYSLLMAAGITDPRQEDRFLRAHWLMMHDPIRRNWEGTNSIKGRYSRHVYWDSDAESSDVLSDLSDYVRSLAESAQAFCDIRRPRRESAFKEFEKDQVEPVRVQSDKLIRIGNVASFTPLLMAVRLRFRGDGEVYRRTAELCERFSFRVYSVLEGRADTGQSRLFRLAHSIYRKETSQGQVLAKLRSAINGWCPLVRFESALSAEGDERNWYRWNGLRYFLYEYEEHLTGSRPVKKDWDEVAQQSRKETIEHILPQTPGPSDWPAFDDGQREKWTHDLGNLVLTFDNSHYSNKPFARKKSCSGGGYTKTGAPRCYEWSPLLQEKKIAEYHDWTPREVRERHAHLKGWAIERWRIEGEDRTSS